MTSSCDMQRCLPHEDSHNQLRMQVNTADTHHGRHLLHRFSAQTKVSSTYKDKTALEEDIRSGELAATGEAAQRSYHAPLRNGWLYEAQHSVRP